MPTLIGEVPVTPWRDAPETAAGWESLLGGTDFEEPPLAVAPGNRAASGAILVEPDARVWVVSPTNQFYGYVNTFPKGTLDQNDALSLRANALKEVFEEAGLRAELLGFLIDSDRTASTTRYYLAKRTGGDPADMGWESQAVHLVPMNLLSRFVSHENDRPVVELLTQR
jgi:8-oxo-dGTP pyrophosphatase MutT (NUDIX family)